MARDHYLLRDAERQSLEAIRVAGIISPQASAVQVLSPQRITNGSLRSTPPPPRPTPQQWLSLPWGTAHPLFDAGRASRANWSEAEVSGQ